MFETLSDFLFAVAPMLTFLAGLFFSDIVRGAGPHPFLRSRDDAGRDLSKSFRRRA